MTELQLRAVVADRPAGRDRTGAAADISVDAAAELRVAPGRQVWFSVKAHEVALHRSPPRRRDQAR